MAAKTTPARKAPGKAVKEWQRHTARLVVRCTPALAARARLAAELRDGTLADVIEAGCEATERRPLVSTLTALREEQDAAAELRADMHDDRD